MFREIRLCSIKIKLKPYFSGQFYLCLAFKYKEMQGLFHSKTDQRHLTPGHIVVTYFLRSVS